MDHNLADLTAQPRPITIDGRTYQVHPLTIDDFGKLQAWCDAQWGDPVAVADEKIRTGRYSLAAKQFMYEAALKLSCQPKPQAGSPETQMILLSRAGLAKLLWLSIHKGDPAFTEEQGDALAEKLGYMQLGQLLRYSEAELAGISPKAETNGETTPG